VPDKKFMQNTFWSSESIQNYSIHKNIQNGIKEDNEKNDHDKDHENENEHFISKNDEILFQDFRYSSNIIENLFPSQNSTHSNVTTSESYTDIPLRGQKTGSPSPLVDQNHGTASPFRGQNPGTQINRTQSIDSQPPFRSPFRRQSQSPPKILIPLDVTSATLKTHTPRADPGQRGGNLKGDLSTGNSEINLEHLNINDNNVEVYRAKKINDVLISNSEQKLSSPNKLLPKLKYNVTVKY
jgi:hypothetical protein